MSPDDEKLKAGRAQRLKTARKYAGFKRAADAMRKFKYKDVYYHHERGHNLIEEKVGWGYARDFKVYPFWLLWNRGKIDTPFNFDENPIAGPEALLLDWGMVTRQKSVIEAVKAAHPLDAQEEFNKAQGDSLLFKLVSRDNSMVPPDNAVQAFKPGNELFFDAFGECRGGDFVLAIIYNEPTEVFRQLRVQETRPDGTKVFALVPLNPFFETRIITSGQTGEIVAKLVRANIKF